MFHGVLDRPKKDQATIVFIHVALCAVHEAASKYSKYDVCFCISGNVIYRSLNLMNI